MGTVKSWKWKTQYVLEKARGDQILMIREFLKILNMGPRYGKKHELETVHFQLNELECLSCILFTIKRTYTF